MIEKVAGAVRSILIDTSTDLRTQALANGVRRVDAILFTHTHADHVFGIDDVRRFNQMQQGPIACYASQMDAFGGYAGIARALRASHALHHGELTWLAEPAPS